jgi:hypothetical protein
VAKKGCAFWLRFVLVRFTTSSDTPWFFSKETGETFFFSQVRPHGQCPAMLVCCGSSCTGLRASEVEMLARNDAAAAHPEGSDGTPERDADAGYSRPLGHLRRRHRGFHRRHGNTRRTRGEEERSARTSSGMSCAVSCPPHGSPERLSRVVMPAQCPYCVGSGHLTCATCLGCGTMTILAVRKGAMQSCPDCEGIGHVTCINCKGDGKLVPTMLDAAVSRDPESELDDIGMT